MLRLCAVLVCDHIGGFHTNTEALYGVGDRGRNDRSEIRPVDCPSATEQPGFEMSGFGIETESRFPDKIFDASLREKKMRIFVPLRVKNQSSYRGREGGEKKEHVRTKIRARTCFSRATGEGVTY